LLQESQRSATPATLDRISRTLEAAAVDDEARELLKTGRLSRELEPSGFETLAGFTLPPRSAKPQPRDELGERRRLKQERERRRRELRERVRELEQQARETEREADRAEAAAADARQQAEKARAAADDAAEEFAALDRE
jgi:hypothetical protein